MRTDVDQMFGACSGPSIACGAAMKKTCSEIVGDPHDLILVGIGSENGMLVIREYTLNFLGKFASSKLVCGFAVTK